MHRHKEPEGKELLPNYLCFSNGLDPVHVRNKPFCCIKATENAPHKLMVYTAIVSCYARVWVSQSLCR